MKHLQQNTFTTKKAIYIGEDSLLVRTKNIREDLEYKIKFEELGFDIIKQRVKTANLPFYLFLMFDLLNLGLLIDAVISKEPFREQLFWLFGLLFFAVMTVLSFYQRNKDVIYLTGGQKTLELLATKPNSETVTLFVEQIHDAMRRYYKNRFTEFDTDVPYEFRLNQLKWLREIQALTDAEYKNLLNNTQTNNIIGFRNTD